MKIADIRTIAPSCPVDPPDASAAGVQGARGAMLVEIENDDGRSASARPGWAAALPQADRKTLKPLLLGEDPLLIEGRWQKTFARTRQYGRRGVAMQAISGIDIALWDIAGRSEDAGL